MQLPSIGSIGMCRRIGYGFLSSRSLKRILFCFYAIRSDLSYIHVLRIHVYHIFMYIFQSLSYIHFYSAPKLYQLKFYRVYAQLNEKQILCLML